MPSRERRPVRPDEIAGIDVVVLATSLRRVQASLQRLARELSDWMDKVDADAQKLERLVDRLSAVSGVTARRGTIRSPEDDRLMRAEAEAGATSLYVRCRPDGTGEVSVSGRKVFALSPKLTVLVGILLAPGDGAEDGLLGWYTTSEVATALNKRTGGSLAARRVPRLVYKLRRAFRDAGENWRLIQTSRERGVRLAVRR